MPPPTTLRAKIRPPQNASHERAGLAGAARIYVSRDSLGSLLGVIDSGRLVQVERSTPRSELHGHEGDGSRGAALRREATLWSTLGGINANVASVSRPFIDACGFAVGEYVEISAIGSGPVPGAGLVEVREAAPAVPDKEKKDRDRDGEKKQQQELPVEEAHYGHWEHALGDYLERAEDIFPGMLLEGVAHGRQRRAFAVVAVDGRTDNLARYSRAATRIRILPPEFLSADPSTTTTTPEARPPLVLASVPGFDRPVSELNTFLAGFRGHFTQRNELCSVAAVLHGPPGTGKTFLLDRIAATGWARQVVRIRPSDRAAAVREGFALAREHRPALVLIDDLHRLLRRDRPGYEPIVEALEDELDRLAAEIEPAQARPQVVVLAACLDHLVDVPAELLKRERFRDGIAVPVPGAEDRLAILRGLNISLPAREDEAILAEIGRRTHAFTPGDLRCLLDRALQAHWTRVNPERSSPGAPGDGGPTMSLADFETALTAVRPSAMRGVDLKPPTVRWGDIGGQESVKRALRRMLRLTAAGPSDPAVRRLIGGAIPKGLLLYGPPGCSKTLSAQAVATESGFNFFSVKGPELLSMYVGESERALRRLFSRAGAASPSIIFFDEIDAIGGQRGGGGVGGPGGGSGSAGSGSGARSGGSSVNMITTLLTEMDGFETLAGVLILAATNRPDALDPALLRPGRFDQVVYVGPPDRAGREAAFRVHLRDRAVGPDVDPAILADATEGNSGADIRHICTLAGLAAHDRHVEGDDRKGRDGGEGGDGEEGEKIGQADLMAAVAQTPKLITRSMVEGYERWQREFRPVAIHGDA